MLCPLCHGHRLFLLHGQLVPCPECEGHGEIHCCDGLQEQPASPSDSGTDNVKSTTKQNELDSSADPAS